MRGNFCLLLFEIEERVVSETFCYSYLCKCTRMESVTGVATVTKGSRA